MDRALRGDVQQLRPLFVVEIPVQADRALDAVHHPGALVVVHHLEHRRDLLLQAGAEVRVLQHRKDLTPLRERGAEIESGPEEYGYLPGYYALFFYDPDGLKLEIVHIPLLAA